MVKKPRFNLMDCIIVLVVAMGIFGGLYILGSLRDGGSASEGTPATLRYTIELAKEDEELAQLFEAAAEKNDICFVGEKERAEAVIKEVSYTPAKVLNNDDKTGEAVWADIPGKYCINVTLESQGSEADANITAGSGTVLKVGDEISVKGKGYAGYGFIIGLEIVKQ